MGLNETQKRVAWLDRNEFSMNEKTFWNRIKYLEEGGWINVIRHSGMKNLYSLTNKGLGVTDIKAKLDEITSLSSI
jgi:DNA-binding HxlR family transcriptional regulator